MSAAPLIYLISCNANGLSSVMRHVEKYRSAKRYCMQQSDGKYSRLILIFGSSAIHDFDDLQYHQLFLVHRTPYKSSSSLSDA